MKTLTASKSRKFLSALKGYRKKYLVGKYTELDESATRLMINTFLGDVLGFASLDEIKTEYMIKGTYADYIVQLKDKRYFIVEVKSMGHELVAKHLRQAVNYAANEGIEWALLTNGRQFDFYRILFGKPIDSRKVFSVDLSDEGRLKIAAGQLQYLTRALIQAKGLDHLWQKYSALEPNNVCKLLYSKSVISYVQRELKRSHKSRFGDDEIRDVMRRIIEEKIESAKPIKRSKTRKHKGAKKQVAPAEPALSTTVP